MNLSAISEGLELQVLISDQEQDALAQMIAEALPPVFPAAPFVAELEEALVVEANRRRKTQQILQITGFVGGGLLTIVAGIVGIHIWRQRQVGELEGGAIPTPALAG